MNETFKSEISRPEISTDSDFHTIFEYLKRSLNSRLKYMKRDRNSKK